MENIIREIDKKLIAVSDAMQVPVNFVEIEGTQGELRPSYDINAIISKIVALCVYSSIGVSANFAPPYNRVHADIEFWKQHFQKIEAEKDPVVETPPPPPTPPTPPEEPASNGADQPQ